MTKPAARKVWTLGEDMVIIRRHKEIVDGDLTIRELADLMGLGRAQVQHRIQRLRKNGNLAPVSERPVSRFVIKDEPVPEPPEGAEVTVWDGGMYFRSPGGLIHRTSIPGDLE